MFIKKIFQFSLWNFLLLFHCLSVPTFAIADFSAEIPPGFKKLGNFRPTFYWIAVESSSAAPRNRDLLDVDGNVLARVTERFWRDIRLEGSGKLLDGRILNFHKKIVLPNGFIDLRFRQCAEDAPFGYGFEDRRLEPFRSLAVDRRIVELDSKIFIPAAKGTVLPDGSIHDGFFKAVDIGDAIQGYRIDVFTGFGDQSSIFEAHGIHNLEPTELYIETSNN